MRTCGECTLCCKHLAVTELSKPPNQWCQHCDVGHGCRIYSDRPEGCRKFECLWLQNETFPEDFRPDRIHATIHTTTDGNTPLIHIDPQTPDHYRYGRLGQFVNGCRNSGLDVIIVAGDRRKILTGASGKEETPF